MKSFIRQIIFLATISCLFALPFKSNSISSKIGKGNLKVIVEGMKNSNGNIGVYLFDSSDGFPVGSAGVMQEGFTKNNGKSAEYIFTNIEFGNYAVTAFHDINSNNKLDRNFVGVPKEGIGVSNHARPKFGPPKFSDASFSFTYSGQTETIFLRYL